MYTVINLCAKKTPPVSGGILFCFVLLFGKQLILQRLDALLSPLCFLLVGFRVPVGIQAKAVAFPCPCGQQGQKKAMCPSMLVLA